MANSDEPKTPQQIDAEIAKLDITNAKDAERIKLLERRKQLIRDITDIITKEEIPALEESIENSKALLDIEDNASKKQQLALKIKRDEFELAQKQFLQKKLSGTLTDKELEQEKEKLRLKKQEYEAALKQQELEQKILDIKQKGKDLLNGALATGWSRLTGYASDFFTEALDVNRQLAQFGKQDLLKSQNYDAATSGVKAFGIGLKETAQAAMALDKSMGSFQNLSPSVQKDLSEMTAKFQNMGISAEGTGVMIQNFSRGLGMSATAAQKQFEGIGVAAMQAGVNPQKAFADLSGAFGQLSANGTKTGKVFIELMKQSKELGVEVNSLLNVVGKSFDTFEGAADKAGKLNAILGGDYLNSVQMLNATEDQRVELMREAFRQSGKNFDELDRFTKKSIAATLGFKDEAEARMALGRVSIEERLRMKSEKEAQDQLTKAQQDSADAMRKIQLAFYSMMPTIQKLTDNFILFANWMSENGKTVMWFVGIVYGLITAFKIYSAFQELAAMRAIVLGAAQATAGAQAAAGGTAAASGSTAMAAGITQVGRAATRSAVGLGVLALVIVSIGASIAIAAFGISHLADSFAKLNGEQLIGFTIALGLFMAGFVAMTVVLAGLAVSGVGEAAALVLVGIGVGIMMIGAGIMLAATGMSLLIESILKLSSASISKNISSIFFDLALGVGALVLSLSGLALIGLNPFALSALAFGISVFALAIQGLAAAINTLPETVEFKGKVESLKVINETIKLSKESGPEMKPATEFIKAAKDFYAAQKESKNADQDALVQALKKVIQPAKERTADTGMESSQIILNVDGEKLLGILTKQKAIKKVP